MRFIRGHGNQSQRKWTAHLQHPGVCACGCGQQTALATRSHYHKGIMKGEPMRFIHTHHTGKRETHFNWKGGNVDAGGYRRTLQPEHPRADMTTGYVLEHIAIAEKALGKSLPPRAVVHHVDENRAHNQNGNLVICQDQKYHALLHLRMRAKKACGNPQFRQCILCLTWADPATMYSHPPRRTTHWHRQCNNNRARTDRTENGEKIRARDRAYYAAEQARKAQKKTEPSHDKA